MGEARGERTKDKWLQDLKPGDRVIVDMHLRPEYAATVQRVTAALIVIDNGDRFRRTTGYKITSDRWHRAMLSEATPERLECVRRAYLIRKLSRLIPSDLDNLPTAALESIQQILTTPEQAQRGDEG